MTISGMVGVGLGVGVVTALSKSHKSKPVGVRLLIAAGMAISTVVLLIIINVIVAMLR